MTTDKVILLNGFTTIAIDILLKAILHKDWLETEEHHANPHKIQFSA